MCTIIDDATRRAISRRGLLGGASGVAALTALGLAGAPAAEAAAAASAAGGPLYDDRFRTKVVFLGTAGGPVWWPGTDREGISTAVVVDGTVYLVDFGDGAGRRLKQAALVPEALQNPGGLWGLEMVAAMFITHLHSDHIADYFNHFLLGWSDGLRNRKGKPRIQVFGPGRRTDEQGNDVLMPIYTLPGEAPPNIRLVNPENPVPGTVEMTDYLYQAYALDLNDRMRDSRNPDIATLFDVHDIAVPRGFGFHPNTNPHPDMPPWRVYEDDRVRVTATLVDHYPVVPAFGFRFDTADGSVVISGDTAPSDNLVRLAEGADILVHEVITQQWIDVLFPLPWSANDEARRNHLLTAHTLPEDSGTIAQRAGVRTLAFSHIVPGFAKESQLLVAKKHFDGQVVVPKDLTSLGVGRPGR